MQDEISELKTTIDSLTIMRSRWRFEILAPDADIERLRNLIDSKRTG
jgi:hypothetical protein